MDALLENTSTSEPLWITVEDMLQKSEFGVSRSRFTFQRDPASVSEESMGLHWNDSFYSTRILHYLGAQVCSIGRETEAWNDYLDASFTRTGEVTEASEVYIYDAFLQLLFEKQLGVQGLLSPEANIQLFVINRFLEIQEVTAIYFHKYLAEIHFTVLTSNSQADDLLADMLLDREVDVLERFPDKVIVFSYIPAGLTEPTHFISPQLIKIFER